MDSTKKINRYQVIKYGIKYKGRKYQIGDTIDISEELAKGGLFNKVNPLPLVTDVGETETFGLSEQTAADIKSLGEQLESSSEKIARLKAEAAELGLELTSIVKPMEVEQSCTPPPAVEKTKKAPGKQRGRKKKA